MGPDSNWSDPGCRGCGNGLRNSARFCDACGAPVSANLGAGERKQVTVLFADVVGSMALAARLDPERLREIMHELVNRAAAVVQRYRGTVNQFTGDGLMALFGAPSALEDHALRACISALEMQDVARSISADVLARDGVTLQIRIGLNSGEVVAGEVGVGPGSYTAVGHPVGMAQRMEAAAAPGGILCSESTARLVGPSVVLAPAEWVTVKGTDRAVAARRLQAVNAEHSMMGRGGGPLIGRDRALADLRRALADEEVSVIGVIGDAGVGKTRLVSEFACAAEEADIIAIRCEPHTATVPLSTLARMLSAVFGVHHLAGDAARARVSAQLDSVPGTSAADRSIVFEHLSISDGEVPVESVPADLRRGRLIAMMTAAVRNHSANRLFVVEDLHWVDGASEDVLTEFAATLAGTPSMFVGTFRPEYRGKLRELCQATVTLAPLEGSATVSLATEILGHHPSTRSVAELVAHHSAGNPLFLEEIIRDLAGSGLLSGDRGDYRLTGVVNSISVPPTVQSVLAARIDRLPPTEKSTLNAAAVIGHTFDLDTLDALVPGDNAVRVGQLMAAEVIDQIELLPRPRYAFRHPLVRMVAYESQLTATRAERHRRLARVLQAVDVDAKQADSALIAHHLEEAGELDEAYDWYMRSAEWLQQRDAMAARDSWERAREIADRLPTERDDVISRRIAPRALLTFTGWQTGSAAGSDRWFDDLRELATRSGDLSSLAMGLSGRLDTLITAGEYRQAATIATELRTLIDRVACTPTQMAEMLLSLADAQFVACEFTQAERTLSRIHELTSGLTDSELAPAYLKAGVIKTITGRHADGCREVDHGLRLAREDHPTTYAIAVAWKTDLVVLGFDDADEALVAETRTALHLAETLGDPYAVALARWAHGTALLRGDSAHRDIGVDLIRESCAEGLNSVALWCDAEMSEHITRRDELDTAIRKLQIAVESETDQGEAFFVGYPAAALVRLMTLRGEPDDRGHAYEIVSRLEAAQPSKPPPVLSLWPLRCRAILAQADADAGRYTDIVTRYRALAADLDARGHLTAADQLASESLFREEPRRSQRYGVGRWSSTAPG